MEKPEASSTSGRAGNVATKRAPTVLRKSASLTVEQHIELGGHLRAIRRSAREMLRILNGKARTEYLDDLIMIARGGPNALCALRSRLEDEMFRKHGTETGNDLVDASGATVRGFHVYYSDLDNAR